LISVRIYPTPQYQYLRRDFADALLSEGAVRIGTLYDFGREEKHGSELGDESEGIGTVYSDDPVEWGNDEDAPQFYKQVLGDTPSHIRIDGIEFQPRHVLPDAYIDCP